MRHQQYREGLLEKLRAWKLANPEGTVSDARRDLRQRLTSDDIDLLFDNWLNANFDRIEIKEQSTGSVVAIVRRHRDAREKETRRAQADIAARRLEAGIKSNLYDEFALRIWDTVLPSGVVMKDATGKDLQHATGWYAELAKRMKPTEKVAKKFSTKELFDLSQRPDFKRAS
jgi:hypothetical protein